MRFVVTVTDDAWRKIEAQLDPAKVHALVMEEARDLQSEMSARTPHRKLAKSLRRRTARTRVRKGQRAEIYAAWWWIFPEYGTIRQPATGAFTKAVEARRARFETRVRGLFRP